MLKGLVLSAGMVLAGVAPVAASAPHAMLRNIDVVAMPSLAPVAGTVRAVFFMPGSTMLAPMARRIVASAVRQAEEGRQVTLVVGEAAGLKPAAANAPVWRARVAAVQRAIIDSSTGRLSDNKQGVMHFADRQP